MGSIKHATLTSELAPGGHISAGEWDAEHDISLAVADITGLQTALDAKQATGSYLVAGDLTPYLTIAAASAAYQPLSAVLTATTASFTTAQETKLSGIAPGATANSSDATLLARANHTGTQLAATVSDFGTAVLANATAVTGLLGTKTVAAFKTGLSLVKGDVGLGSVDNTADAAKAVLSATKLATGRTIGMTGDVTWSSGSFDGSGNVTAAGTLATVNSNVGSFGSATQVATFTVNAKGLTTAAANVTITPAWSSITSKPTTVSGFGITDAGWQLVDQTGAPTAGATTWTWSTNVANVDITGLGGYSQILVEVRGLTLSASAQRVVQVGTGAGPTWLTTSGDYDFVDTLGVETAIGWVALHGTASALARSGMCEIFGSNNNGARKTITQAGRSLFYYVDGSTSPLTAARITTSLGGTNITGGSVCVWVKV